MKLRFIELVIIGILIIIFPVGIYINDKRAENCISKGGQVIETGIIKRSCIYPVGIK